MPIVGQRGSRRSQQWRNVRGKKTVHCWCRQSWPVHDIDEAASLVRGYFDTSVPGKQYTGAFFERLDGGGDRPAVANRITGADLVAVQMLSVTVPEDAAAALSSKANQIEDLLCQIRADQDLVDVEESVVAPESPAWELWQLLLDIPGIGWVTANKLLARKRPRLLPVYDNVVRDLLGRPDHFWASLRRELAADDCALQEATAEHPPQGRDL